MINQGRYPVLGVNVHAVDYHYATDRILRAAREGEPFAVSALAVHGVMTGCRDGVHRRRLNGIDLIVPDGQPVRWALKWLHGVELPDRVYGPELTLQVLAAAAKEQIPVFFYGSTPETLQKLTTNLKRSLPDLPIAGSEASKFRRLSHEEKSALVARIHESGARITFIGLGCPRQETWAFEYREALSMPLIAVGAAFDFHAGTLPQAPPWMQRHGLEWLFRLRQEPGRLWKRYLLLNPAYLTGVSVEAIARRMIEASVKRLTPVVLPNGKEPEESFG